MIKVRNKQFIVFLWILSSICFSSISGQHNVRDKCGTYDSLSYARSLNELGDHWGYGYDQLLADLETWDQSLYVDISSIGNSVEGRPLWEIKITETAVPDHEKNIVYLHARTHPAEVQSTWVSNEIIEFLLSEAPEAEQLRTKCVFYLLPMYNPDGVELEYPRQNANNIDIESNWYSPAIQPEVISLRARFQQLMSSPKPIDIALNMHSAFACKRYFVYHHENGTSQQFTELEKAFISGVKHYYPEGIEAWDYYISWTNGIPLKYPESWWWTNFGASVMALTYEDMNCDAAGNYDHTALAIVKGIADFLEIDLSKTSNMFHSIGLSQFSCSPNPVRNEQVHIEFKLEKSMDIRLEIMDINGRLIFLKDYGQAGPGEYKENLDVSQQSSGMYFYCLRTPGGQFTKKLLLQ